MPTGIQTAEAYRQRYSDWVVLVPILADNTDESDETFSLVISNPQMYFLGVTSVTAARLGTATATATISDRAMTVSVSGPETVNEGGNADFTVTLSRAPTTNLTVNYQTYSALAPLALATSGADFTAQSGTLTFVSGETSKRVRVPILTDSTKEVIEYFRLLLSSPSGGGGMTPTLGTSIATTGIVDAAGPLYGATLTVTPDSSIGEGDTTATDFTVKVDLDCCTTFDDPITMTVSLSGTAIGTDDYSATIANVTIPASAATGSASLSITPADDSLVEGGETIVVSGSAPRLLITTDTIDLTDNDTATVGITGPADEVVEGSNAEFTVTLSAGVAKETTVAWSAPLSADTAVAVDLGATSGTVTFAAGSAAGSTQAISIPITNDSDPEPAETFTVTLGAVGGDLSDLVTVDSTASSATATIAASDASVVLSISSAPVSVAEGQSATFTVKMEGDPSQNVTVVFQTGADGDLAVGGEDYGAVSRTLTFKPTDVTKTVTVQTAEDQWLEAPETFTVSLSNARGGDVLAPVISDGKKTTTIIDNFKDRPEYPDSYTLTASPTTVSENDEATQIEFTVTLEAKKVFPLPVDVVVQVADSGSKGTAAYGDDYTVTGSHGRYLVITVPPNDSSGTGILALDPVEDNLVEGDETVVFASVGGGGLKTSDRPAVTISDVDDRPTSITLSASPSILREDSKDTDRNVTVTAKLDGSVVLTTATTVAVSLESDTAVEGSDYAAAAATITIPAGEFTGSVVLKVRLLDDNVVESDESLSVTGTANGFTVSPVELLILDDDGSPDGIRLHVSPSIVREDAGATSVAVTASFRDGKTLGHDTVIDVSLADGTATIANGDYSASTGRVIIPAEQSYGTGALTFTPADDAAEEYDETVAVEGTIKDSDINVTSAVITIRDKVRGNPAGKPGTPALTRTRFTQPTAPALDVKWTAASAEEGSTITGYRAQYRKKAEAGERPAAWTAYTGELRATDTTLNLANLEAGAVYEIQVRAVTDDGDGPWSDIGEGRANRPPTASSVSFLGGTLGMGGSFAWHEAPPRGRGPFFTDADGDTLTYSASAEKPALLGVSLTGSLGSAVLTANLLNQGASKVNYTASDGYGGQVTRSANITITARTSRSISENSPAGTALGDPVTGTPYDDGDDQTDDALSYTLTGKAADSGLFVIDSSTGQISVATGATLDFETDDTHREFEYYPPGVVFAKFYRGKVNYTVDGNASAIEVLIRVTDVEVGKPDAPSLTRTQFSGPTDPALDVSWTAPTAAGVTITGYEAQYRKKAAAGEDPAAWTAYTYTDSEDGTVSQLPATTTTFNLPNLEAGATYEAQVRAVTSEEGDGPWSDTGEGRANRPPTASSVFFGGGTLGMGGSFAWHEAQPPGNGAFFTDADGDALTYTATAQHPALLGITLTGTAGTNAVLTANLLNQGASKVNYTARDAYGGSVTRSATVTITAKTSREIAENSPAGTAVGDPVTGTPYDDGDPTTDDSLSYSLTGKAKDSGLFVIDSSTGQISVAAGASIDYETDDTHREIEYWPPNSGTVFAKFYRGKVNYTVDGNASAIEVLIEVTDVDTGKPAAPAVTRTEFSQKSNPALDVTWTVPDSDGVTITGYKAQYRKKAASGEDPAAWTAYTYTDSEDNIVSQLPATTTTFNLPNLEAGATYEAQVRAVTSEEGEGPWSDTGEGTANRPPTATSASFLGGTFPVGTIADYRETGLGSIGVLFADADSDTLTYSASAQHPALLGVSLSGAAGSTQLRVTLLNQGSSKVHYTASDAYGGSVTRTATITITAKTSRSIAENSPAGTAVGAPVRGTPYDDGDPQTNDDLTYSLTGKAKDSGLFVIDSSTGQISVASGASIDYETDDTHREIEYWPPNSGTVFSKFYRGKVNYTVDGNASAIEVLIEVTDVDTGKPAVPAVTRTEFSEQSNPALDVTWTAPSEAGGTITGYKAQYRKKVAEGEQVNSWIAYTGTLGATATSLNLPNLDAGAIYEVQVRAVTSEEGDGPWSDTGEGTANRPPTASSVFFGGGTLGMGGSFAWHEAQPPGNGAFFTDADGDTLTYTATAQHPALLGITLTGTAGTNAVLTANLLNQGASKVNYTASDPYGGEVTRSANITITAKTSRSIAENSPAGTAVGDPVTGTPYDDGDDQTNDALSYSLTGKAKDSGLFVIDSSTGQISVAENAVLDYEAADGDYRETETHNGQVIAKFYRGKVSYTVDGHNAVIDVIIKVTDVDTGKPAAPTVTRTEFSQKSNPALDVKWTAPSEADETITGYRAQYRKKVAEGEQVNTWIAYTGTLGASATSLNLPNLDAGATYEVQVLAITGSGDGPWSETGEGTANRPPTASSLSFLGGTLGMGGSFAWHEAQPLGNGAFFTDPDSDTLTYSASAEKTALLGVSLTGAAGSAVLTANLLNQGVSKVNYTARDAYGGEVTRSASITITAKMSRSIAENSSAGTAVGAPVTGAPYDDGDPQTDDALSYTLTGKAKDSGLFVIDSATGQISVATGASIDYETDDTHRDTELFNGHVIAKFYRGNVNYTVDGHASAIEVLIKVTDVNTGKPVAPKLTRTVFSEHSNPALDVTWTAPDSAGGTITGYKAQYRKKAAQGEEPPAWTAYTGTLGATTTTLNLPGLEAGATYEAQVRAVTSEEGEGPWSDTGEGTANRPPTASSVSFPGGTLGMGGSFNWHEEAPLGSGAFFTDADGDTLTYAATAQHPALLGVSLSGSAGSAVLTANLLNQGASKVNYTASDGYGGQVTRSASITITAKTSRSIAEGSAAGTAVGAPVTGTPYDDGDPETSDALTYSLTGNAADSGLFVIDSATGQISVATGASIDYETDDTYRETESHNDEVIAKFYRGKVNYTVDGHAAAIDVNILITDVNPLPVITDPGDKTYKQGEAITAFDITVTDAEGDEVTVTVSGLPSGLSYSAATGQVSGTVAQSAVLKDYTVTISADDGENDAVTETFTVTVTTYVAPTGITLSVTPSSFGEDDGKTEFTVKATLDGVSTLASDTEVTIGTLSGTATKDTDYAVNTSLTSITIPANTASGTGTLEITPTDDPVVEGDETIIVSGTTTTQVGLNVSDATITLTDDNKTTTTPTDDKDSAELSISGPASNVSEGSDAEFTVTLSAEVAAELQVVWSTPLGTDLGTTSGTVTFAAGSAAGATQDITIAVTDDNLSEGSESFTVTLGTITSTLSEVSLKSGAKSATATIAESDPITISISGPSSVDEGDATTSYTVSLSPSGVTPTADLTVSYATANGTATAGTDYTAKSGTLTFTNSAAGSQTFTVQTTEDSIDEASGETFLVAISSPSGGGGPSPSLGTSKSVTTTITDDDDTPTGITLSANPLTLGEDDSATSITVTATLDGDSTRTLSTVVTIDALGGTATKDTDYTATALASIRIPANTASGTATLTVTPTDDLVVEGDETITISGTASVTGLDVSDATVTLTDDDKTTTTPVDDKDSAELSISGPTSNVDEGSDATFTVTLSAAVAAEVQVAWSAPLGTDTASGSDLSATSGTVTFAAGSAAGATQSITITATDDKLSETAESFTVTLGAITSTLSLQLSLKNGAKSATATIAASDPITISITGPSSVDEGDATASYTVSLSPSGVTPTADLTVSYATSDGTAKSGTDYTAKSGTLTFTNADAGSQTFTVQTTEDAIDEGTGETFEVAISSPSGGGGPSPSLGTSKSVTTTITDDDDAPSGIALSASPSSLGEDDGKTSITVTATLSGGSTRTSATVVTIGTLSGTASKDTDYAVNTALTSITIPANVASGTGTLEITPTDDAVVEGDETIVIPGTTTTQVGLTVSSATVALTDDDKTTTNDPNDKDSAELSITGPTSNVNEGSDATFTVTLSKAVAAAVTVAWSAPLETDAAEGADLGATSGTVTFAANSAAGATQSITIRATDDNLSEGSESFTVTLGTITSTLSEVSLKSGAKSATATISASDPITISISGPSSVDEGDATANYTVSLSPSGVTPTDDLTVSYATANGTATAGTDYTAKSSTLTFTNTAAGSQTFTVQTTEDTLDEGTGETFSVAISSPSGGGGPSPSLGTSNSVTTTIDDDDDAPTGITLSANPSTLGEDDSATLITVTAMLDGDSTRTEATVVTIGTLGGTATKDTDYAATTLSSITIAANASSGTATFTVTPTDDSVVEGDETITVSGTTTEQVGLEVSDATITLTDDDKTTTTPTDDKDSAELSISGPTSNVDEGSDATFTVTLSKAVAAAVTVAWSAPLSTDAAQGADLGATSGTVTFAAGSSAGATQSITITATNDALSETAESFTVTLGAITSTLSSQLSLKNGAKSATATIAESDPITISISGPSSVDEGDATTAYTVSLSPSGVKPTSDLTVSYATSDGTATSGTDYTAKSGTLTFTNAAAGSQTFTVETTEDAIDEGTGETLTVAISSPSGGGGPSPSLGTSKTVTTTITDDDDAPSGIALSANPSSLGEDDGKTSITVTATLQGGSARTSATVVTIGTLSGSATKDTDYAVNTALGSITIPANTTSATGTLEITPTDDEVVEGDETIIVSGTTTTQVGLTVSSATVTLTDDDKTTTDDPNDKDGAELSISGPASNVSEGSDATFTVTLSRAVAAAVTVAWSAPLKTDAAEGADLGATSGTVTFAANSAAGATQTIAISTTDDKLSESAESFTVTLGTITSTVSSQVSLKSGASSATATIAASDPITISVSGPSSVDEGDATANYTVSLSPSGVTPTEDLTVSYGTSDGTATAGSDYTSKSSTLTFTNAAAGSQTFTVQTTEDTLDEGTGETFSVTISSPSGGGGPSPSLGTSKSVTTTITDDDAAPTGITLSASPSTLGEDDGKTSITVKATLDGDSTRTSTTVVTIGALSGTATKDTDYAVSTALGSITIPANTASATGTLEITPTDDSVVEGDETIIVSGTTTTQVGLDVSDATVTLTDDDKTTTTPVDDKDSAELSISGPTSNVSEGRNATFTVTLSAAVAAEVQVAWSTPLGTDAASGADLGTTSGTVTFAANSAAGATQSITITATDDALSETAESFTVTLGDITSTLKSQLSLKNGASSATATIAASDPITISISGPSSVDEGDATANYTVSLSPSGVTPTSDLTVSYATSDGTATSGTDYTAKTGTLTFTNSAAGSQTFTVQTTEDIVDEGTGETFTVTISSPSGGGGPSPSLGTSKSVTTTITDDDDAPSGITLSASPSSLGEDEGKTSITVTATLGGGSTRTSPTVVTIGALSGSATKNTDYSVNTSLTSITIPANTTSGTGTLEITPTDDAVVEGDETIVVSGTTTTQVGLSVSEATITLTDDNKTTTTPTDDKDTAELSITGPTSNVAEGSNAVFTVTLSAAVAAEVQVAWSAPLGTDAAAGSDLGTTSGTVTFAAGSAAGATQSITITATDDKLSESAESFTVTLGTITSTLSSQVSLKSGGGSATATISASDPITISISGPSSVDEGDATTSYTVSLSPSGVTPTADLTVSYATSNGTATAGTDYTAKSGTLTFTNTAAGPQTFKVQTTEDVIDEGSGETFTVAISSPSGGGGPSPSLGTSKTVTTTITDDDAAPSGIALSANPSSLGEDDGKTSITVTATLNGGTTRTEPTVVTIGTLSGTATKDTDYSVNTALTSITIAANASSGTGTLEISPTDDAVVEGDETIIVSGTTTTQVGLSVSDTTITLSDDNKTTTTPPDDKDTAELSIAGPTLNVAEGSDAVFTVTLSKAVAVGVEVAWSAPLGTDSAEGADLSATGGKVTFAAGSAAGATQDITIAVTDDTLSETAESFTVTLGAITSTLSSQLSLKSGAKAATATIAESDPITIELSGPVEEVTEGDAGTYTVSLSPSGVTPTSALTVSYTTVDGTAVAGSDYSETSGTFTFTTTDAGDKTFTVQTTEDILAENSEDFTVTISGPTGGGGPTPSLGTSSSVTTTIRDNDALILSPTSPGDTFDILLTVDPDSVDEGAGSTSFTVTAEHNGDAQSTDVTIQLALAGTATAGATNDYTAPAQASVTIPANSTSGTATLTLTINDDNLIEGDETIIVGGSVEDLTVRSAVITIDDDESTYLSITGPTAEVQEGSNASFTVTLSETVSADVTVAWSATTSTGTARAADLGTPLTGSVTFPANSSAGATQTITVPVVDDALSEGTETFSVQLGADTGDQAAIVWVKTTAAVAVATIAESDPITISISGPTSVEEGDATTAYTVSLSPSGVTPTEDLTVAYATSDGTATGSDYTAASGTLTFTRSAADPKTFTVQTTEDAINEDAGETFIVTISSPAGGGGPAPILGTDRSVTTTITDDEHAPSVGTDPPTSPSAPPINITLSVSPNSLSESDGATSVAVTATLTGGTALPADTVVTIGTLGGSATLNTDYAATSLASITIPANTTSGTGTITITPTSDSEVEGDETIVVSGSTTSLNVSAATITLTDVESATAPGGAATLSIASASSSVAEGGNALFVVTLSHQVDADVTVSWSAPLPADAAEAADLAANSGSVTFGASSGPGATQTFTIAITDDMLSETAETFTVTLGTVISTLSSQVSVDAAAGSASATIAESDPIRVILSGPSRVDEGEATTAYTVSLSPSGVTPTEDLTVRYATANGTATAGSDYTAASGTLTFSRTAAGPQTFTVQTRRDAIDEPDETFNVYISRPAGGGGPAPVTTNRRSVGLRTTQRDAPGFGVSSVTTTITDGTPADIALSVDPDSLREDGGAVSVTVTARLNGRPLPVDTVVTIESLTGSAAQNTDYTATSLASITIPANSTSGTGAITITPIDDTTVEGDETITVSGSATGQIVKPAVITLVEDDSAELSISGPSVEVLEAGRASFTVTLSGAVSQEVTVAWSARAGTAGPDDYSPRSGTVRFAGGSAAGATRTINIAATDDMLSEAAETFSVALGTVGGDIAGHVSLRNGASSASATIAESDPITVNVSGPASVDEGELTAAYIVSLSPKGVIPTADLTVSYGTSDGTATAGSDYTARSGRLTFTRTDAGAQSFTVSTTEDTVDESGETFIVNISGPAGGGGPAPRLGTSSVTTTISDDDGSPADTAPDPDTDDGKTTTTLTDTADESAVEGGDSADAYLSIEAPSTATPEGSTAEFTVTLSRPVAASVTVAWSVTPGTADAADYATEQGTVTFPANSAAGATQVITIAVTDDNLSETTETFTVALGTISGGRSDHVFLKEGESSATATIAESDPITVSISGPSRVEEGDVTAIYTVTLYPTGVTPTTDLTLTYATSDGTAVAGSDYSAKSGTLTFTREAAGPQTFTVQTTEDTYGEPSETFIVYISSPAGGGGPTPGIGTSSVTTTIADDDLPGDIEVSISSNGTNGHDGATSVTLTTTLGGSTTLVTMFVSRDDDSGEKPGLAATPTPETTSILSADPAGPLSWISPRPWILLVIAAVAGIAIAVIKRLRNRSRPSLTIRGWPRRY